jgi:uncharacterized membrane protein
MFKNGALFVTKRFRSGPTKRHRPPSRRLTRHRIRGAPKIMDRLAPADLSRELREGQSPDLSRRRWAIGLSFVGAAIGTVVSLYQTGILKRLPDILPGKVFDAEKVDSSDYAYKRLQSPDGPLMVMTYAATAAFAAAGGAERATRQPAMPLAFAGKALYDLATCLKLAQEEWAENKKLCSWCQVATAISAVTAALSLPEAIRAGRSLTGNREAATA